VALAGREAAVMGLMDPTAISDALVVRQRKVLPIEDEACAEHRAMIRLDLKMQFPSLHLAGRNGLHRDGERDHATLSGLLTAENILAGEAAPDVGGVSPAPRPRPPAAQAARRSRRAASAEGLVAPIASGSLSDRADQHSRCVRASARPITAITVTTPDISRIAIIDMRSSHLE